MEHPGIIIIIAIIVVIIIIIKMVTATNTKAGMYFVMRCENTIPPNMSVPFVISRVHGQLKLTGASQHLERETHPSSSILGKSTSQI